MDISKYENRFDIPSLSFRFISEYIKKTASGEKFELPKSKS